MKSGRLCLLLLVFLLSSVSLASGKERKQLMLLRAEKCKTLDASLMPRLPAAWQPFSEFVKICPLEEAKPFPIAIVSIWVMDYYKAKFPTSVPSQENFPLPLIVSEDLKIIGKLPEHYPDDPPREVDIYYLKKSAEPPEIKLKVYNPAVDGDYTYSPIKWNSKAQRWGQDCKVANSSTY